MGTEHKGDLFREVEFHLHFRNDLCSTMYVGGCLGAWVGRNTGSDLDFLKGFTTKIYIRDIFCKIDAVIMHKRFFNVHLDRRQV